MWILSASGQSRRNQLRSTDRALLSVEGEEAIPEAVRGKIILLRILYHLKADNHAESSGLAHSVNSMRCWRTSLKICS
jgi:hypothetical protein